MADETIVEPVAPVVAVEPTTPAPEAAAPAKGKNGLPDELLQIPAMQAIFAGQPAAFSASLEEFKNRPEAKKLIEHKDDLMKAGMQLYRSLDGGTGVVFNSLFLHPEEIKSADTEGRLQEIAPPFDTVNDAVGKSGADNPVLSAQTPAAAKSLPNPTSPQPTMPPAPASSQKKLASARIQNSQLGAPTSGPAAGQGKILRSILKPVI